MSETNELTLCQEIINVFGDELTKIFIREKEDPKYMKQTILGCRFRAFVAILTAVRKSFKRMYRILALAIAQHRNDNHKEDKINTIVSLSRSLDKETVESVTSKSFWMA